MDKVLKKVSVEIPMIAITNIEELMLEVYGIILLNHPI